MPASRNRQARRHTRVVKEEIDPLPLDDPAYRPTRIAHPQILITHLGVVEELLTTLQAYLHDLAVSDTLLVRLGTVQSAAEQQSCAHRLTANVQDRTMQLATLQALLSFLAQQRVDSDEEPPESLH